MEILPLCHCRLDNIGANCFGHKESLSRSSGPLELCGEGVWQLLEKDTSGKTLEIPEVLCHHLHNPTGREARGEPVGRGMPAAVAGYFTESLALCVPLISFWLLLKVTRVYAHWLCVVEMLNHVRMAIYIKAKRTHVELVLLLGSRDTEICKVK